MPISTCPHCDHEQLVRSELIGLSVACEECARQFAAKESKAKRPANRLRNVEEVEVASEGVDFRAMLRGVGLTAGLMLAGVMVLGAVIWLTRPAKPEPAAEGGQYAKYKAGADERARNAEQVKANQTDREDTAKAATAALGVAVLLALVAILGAYGLAILLTGGWIAGDAYARGMGGLSWTSFYFVCQLVARVVTVIFFIIPSLLIPGFALVASLISEPVAWIGLAIYLYARPSGRMGRCANCRQRRLGYLVRCPRCGIGD